MLFLVTNKHVVAEARQVNIRFVLTSEHDPDIPDLRNVHHVAVADADQWFMGHPDPQIDVAVAPLAPMVARTQTGGRGAFFRALTPDLAMTAESAANLDALEQITFIGYPSGLYDRVNNLPIARRGFTATPPSVDFGGQPIFLVDASVFPGSSGSPVLIAQSGGYTPREGGLVMGARVLLLGVLAAVYERSVPVIHLPTPTTGQFVRDALNIGIVFKAEALDATVDSFLSAHGLSRPQEPAARPDQAGPVTDPLPEEDALT